MKRITMVLQESDAARVRKAVCAAGGEQVVQTPLPSRLRGMDKIDIQCERAATELCKPVRLDVTASDDKSGSIISAIRNIARIGKFILVSTRHRLSRLAA
jgi:nitrogen regulatory protein PII